MKIGAIGIRTKIIVGDAATWYLVKKYIDGKIIDLATDYETLNDKPKINDVELSGNKTSEDLGLVSAVEGKSLVDDLEIEKLAGIEENANNYTHPQTHPASILDVVDVVNGAANKFLNERGEMVAVATSSIGVTGSQLYASTANSDVAGYKSLVGTPQPLETEIALTAKSSDGIVWGAKYLSAPFTESVTIPTTAYGFDYWRKVSAVNGTSRKHLRVFLYRAGVETNIITPLISPEIDDTEFTERQISYIFPELVLLAGDRIGIQEGFSTTHANNITLTYIVGDGRGWFMRLPLPLKHENLTDKNSEAAIQHVDTTVTKETLDAADMVALYDSVTGKVVLTPKSNLQTAVVQSTGESETDVMSQKSVTTELAAKELKANKQNSLTPDGTGTKFPTVDAVNEGLANSNLLATYVHSGNLEVAPTAVDLATGTFTKTAHGLINGDRISPIINIGEYVYPFNVYPSGLNNTDYGHYVVGVTPNTFQISLTSGGAPVTFTTNALMDLTKWHFERIAFLDYKNTSIKLTNSFKIVYSLRTLRFSNLYLGAGDTDKWIGSTTIPQTADVAVGIAIPNSLIYMSHVGYAEQKYIASPNMSSIHMTARMFQTGTTLNKYLLKYADSIKVVNSNYIQASDFWIYGICPANGFKFNIYKL